MYVEPIGLGAGPDYSWIASTPRVRDRQKRGTVNPFNPGGPSPNPLRDIVTLSTRRLEGAQERTEYSPRFNYLYLMYPHEGIAQFAYETVGVRPDESNDRKMAKIAGWVQNHIQYKSDMENYKVPEFWAPPVFTLALASGDCEDGAFLMASLALNSGVPPSRIRMYGGYVQAGAGAPSGGHGWVGYQREADNKWVAVDFSYFPDADVRSLPPMSEDLKYRDDYFFMTVSEITHTPGTNRVRNPENYNRMAAVRQSVLVGQWVNLLA